MQRCLGSVPFFRPAAVPHCTGTPTGKDKALASSVAEEVLLHSLTQAGFMRRLTVLVAAIVYMGVYFGVVLQQVDSENLFQTVSALNK